MPTNTQCQKEMRPRKPPTRFHAAPSAPNMSINSRTWRVNESCTTPGTKASTTAIAAAINSGSRAMPTPAGTGAGVSIDFVWVVLDISPPSEQATRPVPENHNKKDEDTDCLQCGSDEIAGHRLDQADQNAGNKSAR